ncbi:MAG: ATP-binding cassette domain-containing protein, partial [Actinomycetota bacterium]|nr:ATP-binding cassette domain-containing protein [Actinomycetota bacterium]
VRQAHQARQLIGLTGQYAAVDEMLTGAENLLLIGRLLGVPRAAAKQRARELLTEFDLTDAADRAAKTYSGGMRRRLDLASALTGRPRILFLDEPTTGLDPRSRLAMWEVIRDRVREGTTLLLTTQYLEEADELAHSIAVVDAGRIIARGTADELKSQIGGERIELVLSDAAQRETASRVLGEAACGEIQVGDNGRALNVPVDDGQHALLRVLRGFEEHGIDVLDIGLRRPTLDDVFLALTGHVAEVDDEIEETKATEEVPA